MILFFLGFISEFTTVIAIGAWRIHVEEKESLIALVEYMEDKTYAQIDD